MQPQTFQLHSSRLLAPDSVSARIKKYLPARFLLGIIGLSSSDKSLRWSSVGLDLAWARRRNVTSSKNIITVCRATVYRLNCSCSRRGIIYSTYIQNINDAIRLEYNWNTVVVDSLFLYCYSVLIIFHFFSLMA